MHVILKQINNKKQMYMYTVQHSQCHNLITAIVLCIVYIYHSLQ